MPEQYTSSAFPAHLIRTTALEGAKQPQSKKRVRFQSSITVQPIDCNITTEEKASSYYTKDELERFQLEVKVVRNLSKMGSCEAHGSKRDCAIGTDADPALRGLEVYLCPLRNRNKILAQKALVKYQKNLQVFLVLD